MTELLAEVFVLEWVDISAGVLILKLVLDFFTELSPTEFSPTELSPTCKRDTTACYLSSEKSCNIAGCGQPNAFSV